MQALASKDYLRYVDYLSTVSGGGYIGGSLTWLINSSENGAREAARQPESPAGGGQRTRGPQRPFGTRKDNFPFGTEDPRTNSLRGEDDPVLLRHLREHGKYLAPGGGITLTSLIAVILRGIVLNMLVWMPLGVALMVVLLFGSHALSLYANGELDWRAMQYVVGRGTLDHMLLGGLWVWAAFLMAVLFVLASIVYALTSSLSEGRSWYLARRWFESKIRWPLWAACGLVVSGSLPFVHEELDYLVEETGLVSIVLGGLTFLFSLKGSGGKGGGLSAVFVPVASGLFLYGLALSAYWIALFYFAETWVQWALLAAVAVAINMGWQVNLNYISIHRYYRDRLMETFMPDPPAAGKGTETGPAFGANKAELSKMCGVPESVSEGKRAHPAEASEAPYHIINTNVVLVDSDDRRLQLRGGDNFILSALYSGSAATGWARTATLTRTPLTLATAVAISAAAANPNTGVGGEGATRNPLLSMEALPGF